ncbi:MAG: hypothetical protein B7Z75_00480 [Acidocella sp. 20-57-95]|nr:MAG: hypothetical protein B7Z75_00480 [Acidocella sp. 20-57-95]OYV59653.1 MAG: hypothetical protein B7Z71_07640 [Acidocella sp. 21-58-7]HQT63288.1 DUF3311 domain-containing protein [Acidocella sp.]HQU03562.1 DUF3311 domain-containing protein [Acidocella sp.]
MIRWLLAVIFVLALSVPFFNQIEPSLFGFPFFYWYQMLIVPVAAGLTYIVFIVENKQGDAE